MPFTAPPARAGARVTRPFASMASRIVVADRADRQVAVGVDEVGVEGGQVGDGFRSRAEGRPVLVFLRFRPASSTLRWLPVALARSSAFGPSGGSGCSCREAPAAAMISASVSPNSSRQCWACSRGGQPCHQPGRVAVEAQRGEQIPENLIGNRCARLRALLLLTGSLRGSLTRLVSGFRRWPFTKIRRWLCRISGDGSVSRFRSWIIVMFTFRAIEAVSGFRSWLLCEAVLELQDVARRLATVGAGIMAAQTADEAGTFE